MQAASWAMHTLADDHTHHADAVICTAGAEDEARTCLEMGLANGALQHIVSRISLPTIKQVNSGANLLQKVQHLLLFGDGEPALVTRDLFVMEDFKVRRCTDNARRLINYKLRKVSKHVCISILNCAQCT